MCDEKQKQRINLKFLVKLKKTPTECYKLLQEAYGGNSLSRARVFEWYKRFSEGRESTEDDQRPGRPVTVSTPETVTKINQIVRADRRMSIRMIAEAVNADNETVRKILHEELHLTKVCAKLVPKNLTPDQKFLRQQVCSDFLEKLKEDPGLMKNIITCDETWIFQYDVETKRQSMHWKTPESPRIKKARMSKSKFKAMLIVFFFDIIVMTEWVPEGQTVNQIYYLSVLATLRKRDNAPAHNALSVKQYLAGKRTPVLEHAPYSPDLAPCDFFLFPKIKSALKGTRFESMEAVKQKTAELLKALTEEDFQHCFDQWKKRMERRVARGGEYIEGEYLNVE
ncbi:Transposase, type 1 [Cinara cedri]|uniref:Transposase, type 1 n=1 Tax=Cinara cedri TaxID=506608 RepID=A0A5E4NQ11_9HEMI|nr:Transposase, type 1 [Cinara cedri]